MNNNELYEIVLTHFENVDKLADMLEQLVDKVRDLATKVKAQEKRIRFLESRHNNNGGDNTEGVPELS